MMESLRVLRGTRTTAVKSRRVALHILRAHIVSTPEELRDSVRNLTRRQLLRFIRMTGDDPVQLLRGPDPC